MSDRQDPLKKMPRDELVALASSLISRSALASRLGQAFTDAQGNAHRNLYQALGYNDNPGFEEYWNLFLRQDVATRIISAPVSASWSLDPEVVEGDDETETPFEKEWKALQKKRSVLHYLQRVDLLSGIGRYGVLFLGVKDGKVAEEPLEAGGKRELLYLRPYVETSVKVSEWETDTANPRYGLPRYYSLQPRSVEGTNATMPTQSIRAHWTRVLHVAEETLEDDVNGTPRLQNVLNRLGDLEKVVGGSAEMFWQGALPGHAFKADKEFGGFDQTVMLPGGGTSTVGEQMTDEIEAYVHGLKRYLKLQGIDVQNLSPQVASPQPHVSVILDLIAAARSIPKRILIGSERGELASVQDDANWADHISNRREKYCEPRILRPFLDWAIEHGVLPSPGPDGYSVRWPDLHSSSAKERADVAKVRTEALSSYAGPGNAESVLPRHVFLTEFMELPKDQVEEIERENERLAEEEARQMEEE
jgi:hypothetical protein